MFCRMVTYRYPGEETDKVIAFYEETGLPSLKRHEGFLRGYMFLDRAGGKVITISLWESEAHLRASEVGHRLRRAKAKDTGVEALAEEYFEAVEGL